MAFAVNPPNGAMVDRAGRPTPEWYRFFANLQRLLGGDLIDQLQDATYLTAEVSAVLRNERVLSALEPISLDFGPATAALSLDPSGVTAGAYGSNGQLLRVAIDQYGRIGSVAEFELNSDNVTEGDDNLYFTQDRARGSVSAGDGLDYNGTTGEFSASEAELRALLGLDDGTYTPALTNVANVTASTAYACQFMRVGNTVTVSGKIDVTPTAPGVLCQIGIALPVASALSAQEQVAGTAADASLAAASAGIMSGDIANDRAELQITFPSTAPRGVFWQFTYRIG